jgi:sulfite exporter TauE/SafE
VAAYAASATAGGALAGAALGWLGAQVADAAAWLGTAAVVAAALLAVYAVALESAGRVAPLPERAAQVPRRWTLWRNRSRTAVAFGLMLGAGGFTWLHHAAMYVLALIAAFSASPAVGAAVGALYGLGRGLMLVVAWLRRGESPSDAVRRAGAALPVAAGLTVLTIAAAVAAAQWN